jgi:alpha-methylacyl-CoA racemase
LADDHGQVADAPALAGVRVVDLTRLLPGPLATLHLRELGADVLKIEGPAADGQDDGARRIGQTEAERASATPSHLFRQLNAGKQLQTLDLRTPAGCDTLRALAHDADVLVEGFRPGVMARLGFSWERLQALNPRLVVCAISGYGQRSAWAQRAGHDINYIAMAGVLEQIATPGGEIALPNFQIGDLLGGTQAAVAGVLAGLLAAQRTGRGRFVDISMTHAVMRHQAIAGAALQASGRTPPPGRDLLSGGTPCYGVYATADGRHLAVGALELKFWTALCQTIGHPEWAAQHWSLGLDTAGATALALRDQVAAVFAAQTLAHWVALFETVDACVTPVLRLDEARRHPLFVVA